MKSSKSSVPKQESLAALYPYQATWAISWAENNLAEITLPCQTYHTLPKLGTFVLQLLKLASKQPCDGQQGMVTPIWTDG